MCRSRLLKAASLSLVLAITVACLTSAQSTKSQPARQQQQQPRPAPEATQPPRAVKSAQAKRPQQAQQQQQLDYGQNEQASQGEENSSGSSDSEPALYGSVAGQPGIDFPNYQRVPKTSFSCEGKGFDFGFYADEETQCQAYHVCWEGRRESFLCGVGTVFNQAILACDYWHSVDCSKSSQFYGVNSELGKAGAEPAAQKQPRQQPVSSSSSSLAGDQDATGGQPSRPAGPVAAKPPTASNLNAIASFVPQRSLPASSSTAYDYNSNNNQKPTRPTSIARGQQQETSKTQPTRAFQQATTTLATPPAAATKRRPSFNMDLNQKVHSLIESPVRPPIKSTAPRRQPAKQQPANFAQAAVARAQQSGSQTLSGGSRPKTNNNQAQFQQQQQSYDTDLDQNEPQQRPLQQAFDDSPVQTTQQQPQQAYGQQQQFSQERLPEMPQLVVRAGGSGDGSSAITSQYDTYNNQPQLQQQQLDSNPNSNSNYDGQQQQQADDSSGQSDDFRSAGAKAAASHNQNWYIMRTI